MKKLIVLLFAISLFAGCDKVPPRIPPVKPDCLLDSTVMVVNTNTTSSTILNLKKVLLEDYTGHRCGNCPPAIQKVEELTTKYKTNLVTIANHVTKTYAAPLTTKYFEDFRDPASTDWDAEFNISGNGLPKGTVNRMVVGNARTIPYANWDQYIGTEAAKPQTVKLAVTTYYDPSQKLLNVKVLSTFKAATSSNIYISMVLSLDGVISDQTDYAPPSGSTVVDSDRRPDFVFNHIMVKSLNGTWGQLLKAAPIAANDTVSFRKECNLVTKCFYTDQICAKDDHLYLVVFAYDEKTKEVLQVEKVKLIPEK